MISIGFIQKTIKVDLDVRVKRAYPQQNRHQKTLEDSRGLHTKVKGERLSSGAAQPLGPPVSLRVAMFVLHRFLGCIYVIL